MNIKSAVTWGVDGHPVEVEAHIRPGLPSFTIVGATASRSREMRDIVRAAMLSSNLGWPTGRIRVTVRPSELQDGLLLPIAVAILAAEGKINPHGYSFVGGLMLDGTVTETRGIVSVVDVLGPTVTAYGAPGALHVGSLVDVVGAFGVNTPKPWMLPGSLADAVEIAAAGGHHLFVEGELPGGFGERLRRVLPELTVSESHEVRRVRSAASEPSSPLSVLPPLREPDPATVTMAEMVGGRRPSMGPGEYSLAHNGVLVLRNIDHFAPHVLDSLRQPLETGEVRVARGTRSVTLPAGFLAVASLKPEGDERERRRQKRTVSGPILSQFGVRVRIDDSESPRAVDVDAVRAVRRMPVRPGALSGEGDELVDRALRLGELTARGVERVKRVARTVADLRGGVAPTGDDVATALKFSRA